MWPVPLVRVRCAHHTAAHRAQEERVTSVDRRAVIDLLGGLATAFYREVATFLPDPDRRLVLEVLADTGHADFAVREVRAAIAADRKVAGRLSLWGRRLVGEAITRSQAVIAEHDRLAELIIGGTGDLGGVAQLIERITDAHSARMKALGLRA